MHENVIFFVFSALYWFSKFVATPTPHQSYLNMLIVSRNSSIPLVYMVWLISLTLGRAITVCLELTVRHQFDLAIYNRIFNCKLIGNSFVNSSLVSILFTLTFVRGSCVWIHYMYTVLSMFKMKTSPSQVELRNYQEQTHLWWVRRQNWWSKVSLQLNLYIIA